MKNSDLTELAVWLGTYGILVLKINYDNGTIVQLPPNMDITDYYLANGADATKHLLGVPNV